MKVIVGALIVCLIACGLPQAVRADSAITTTQNDSSSDSGSGSEANNITIGLLAAVVIVILVLSVRSDSSDSIVQKSKSPLSLYASTDDSNDAMYESGKIVTTGLALATDF